MTCGWTWSDCEYSLFKPSIIAKNGQYKSVMTTAGLHFLDLANYCAADVSSLEELRKAYTGQSVESLFPVKVLSQWPAMSSKKPALTTEWYDLFRDPFNLTPPLDIAAFHA